MRKFILCHLIILLSLSNGFASKTILKGQAKGFDGKEITIYTYKDYFSKEKVKIGYTTIKQGGHYLFEFDLTEIKQAIVKIEDKSTWLFTEPGKVYNITLLYDQDLNKGRVYDKKLSLIFNFPVPTELNQQIKWFNSKYDQFIEDNILLFKKRNRSIEPKLKAFKTKTLKEFEGSKAFVLDYIQYTFASTQNSLDVAYTPEVNKTTSNTKANIYIDYLQNKPIRYHNPEYVNFFREFFKGEMKSLSLELTGYGISQAVNDHGTYAALSKALSKYPFLQDKEFRNLFMLNGLYEIYNDKYFTKKNVLGIMEEIIISTSSSNQKEIGKNLIKKLTRIKFGQGSKAPLFSLKDVNGKSHSLSNFKGKPVYINFWTSWSIPALKEMKVMQTLHKKYKSKIHFISICADNDKEKLKNFLSKNPDYKWLFLHIADDKHLLDKYQVMAFPTYVLLDENLMVYKYPAGRPGGTAERATEDNIEKDFFELTK